VLLEWAERQKKLLDTVEQSHHKMAEALLSLYDLGLDLGDRYFLLDIKTQIVFFSSMNFYEGDAIFICCQRHPLVNKVELGQMQNIFTFCDHKHKQLSNRFTYVLQFSSSMHGGYGLVELFGKDYSTEPKTRAEVRRRGLDLLRSHVHVETIGNYTGPKGGGNDIFFNPKIKRGMTIEAFGIVVDVVAGTS
jgi:hypothetical protein